MPISFSGGQILVAYLVYQLTVFMMTTTSVLTTPVDAIFSCTTKPPVMRRRQAVSVASLVQMPRDHVQLQGNPVIWQMERTLWKSSQLPVAVLSPVLPLPLLMVHPRDSPVSATTAGVRRTELSLSSSVLQTIYAVSFWPDNTGVWSLEGNSVHALRAQRYYAGMISLGRYSPHQRHMGKGGKLVDQTLAEFNQGMLDRVTGHFLLFKTFIPYLDKQQGSTYTILTGDAGNDYVAPNISLICVTSGAMNGFSTAARAEHKDSQVAVSDFRIHIMVYPKPDSEFPSTETHTMGNDVIGKAIVNSIIKRSRDRIDVRVRKDAPELAK